MRGAGQILLVATYELGHQPAGLTWPKAFLERAGFRPAALDLQVEPLDPGRIRAARLVAISVPMHTALRLGLRAAERVRELNPAAAICFHGLYAPLYAPLLYRAGAAAVLGAESEEALVALAAAMERGDGPAASDPARRSAEPAQPATPQLAEPATPQLAEPARLQLAGPAKLQLAKPAKLHGLAYPVPSRTGLPGPERYARLAEASGERTAGHTEATRGCKHRCRHCPLPVAYRGRFFAIPEEVVVEDVSRQVASGVTHVTFGDPDFLNGPRHALRVAEAIHRRFPALTFDFTAKVEHLVAQAALLPALRRCGALFTVSAVESLSDAVLERLDKGHTRADVFRAFAACRAAGIALRPSLLPFTPWSTLGDYLDLLEAAEREGWLSGLDPVQLSIRLLVPPGSLLLESAPGTFGPLDESLLSHAWRHPDPRMDRLQAGAAALAEAGAACGEPAALTFGAIRELARGAAGLPHQHRRPHQPVEGVATPRLTESWFC